MSVVGNAEVIRVTGGIDSQGERTYTKVYRVRTSTSADGPLVVRSAPGLERYNDAYSYGNEGDPGCVAVSITADLENPTASAKVWNVTIGFSSVVTNLSVMSINPATGQPIDHPLLRPVAWSGSYLQYAIDSNDEHYTIGKTKPIVNSVGELQSVPIEASKPTITAVKNQAQLSLSQWAAYRDTCNSDSIWGLERRMAKVSAISWVTRRWGKVRYYEVTYNFQIDFEKWIVKLPHRSYRARESQGQEAKLILEKGVPLAEPAWLDQFGVRLSQADIDAGEFWQTEHFVYPEKPFAALGLPTTIEA